MTRFQNKKMPCRWLQPANRASNPNRERRKNLSIQISAPTTNNATRYVALGTDVHDTQSNRIAEFPTPSGAHVAAEWLNEPGAKADDYAWTDRVTPSARLSHVRDLEWQIADLKAKRTEAIAAVVADLEWMEVPTQRVMMLYVDAEARTATAGTRVHVLRQYQERGDYDTRSVHLADTCDSRVCRGVAGEVVKGGGQTRWRFLCEGEFEVVGIVDGAERSRRHGGDMILSRADV